MSHLLPCVEVSTGENPQYAIIWLHGLGADGHDFEPVISELSLPDDIPVRFVFPHAPVQKVSLNNGMEMRSWYDIYTDFSCNKKDIYQSAQLTVALIENEMARGMESKKIILAGFSQGGVIVMHTGLRYPKPLGGIMALSTYLPTANNLPAEAMEVNLNIPIFMAHGSYDMVVPLQKAVFARQALNEMKYNIEWHEYPMEHSLCATEIDDISCWLSQIIC